jgi:hypothetical protein
MKRPCDIVRCAKGLNDISSQRQCYWAKEPELARFGRRVLEELQRLVH